MKSSTISVTPKARFIDLPHGYQAIIDEADWPVVSKLTLYRGTNGYVYFSKWENGKSIPRTLHGLLIHAPKGSHIDHFNGNKLDNRRGNLRVVTPQNNQLNRHKLNKNNTSGARGIKFRSSRSNPWVATICVMRKSIHLGVFATKESAIEARRMAELKYFGEVCP